ncbi:hypothetical protein HPP92_009417 [Vanilla planifolia]|uniref:Uncharacterized protein n=1 Tax=Vanilla planifolia TaxID=51239 RepID=A0A835R7U4_VANPL|nr:hypothetical protein HPP92_009417 [Vanilla planifolia]
MSLRLGSHLDALAFLCYSYWSFLVFLAAALFLLRIRSLGLVNAPPAKIPPPSPKSTVSPPESPQPTFAPVDSTDSGVVGSPKERIVAYFYSDEEIDGNDEELVEWGRPGYGGDEGFDLLGFGSAGILAWYQFQDRTAINGNVVRLWDGGLKALTTVTAFHGRRYRF